MDEYADLRRELPRLARSLGLGLDHYGDAPEGYVVVRGDISLAYCTGPTECKAFLRGYQHGLERARKETA